MKLLRELLESVDGVFRDLPEDLVAALRERAPKRFEALSRGDFPLLYRGVSHNKGAWQFGRTHSTDRDSMTGINSFMDLVSALPNWRKFPNRKRSVFTNTKYSRAKLFAESNDVYVVLPFDEVQTFGVVQGDFNFPKENSTQVNHSFANFVLSINRISLDLSISKGEPEHFASDSQKKIIRFLKSLPSLEYPAKTPDNLLAASQVIDKLFDFIKADGNEEVSMVLFSFFGSQLFELQETIEKNKTSVLQMCRQFLNTPPEENGYMLATSSAELSSQIHALSRPSKVGVEVWFEGPHVLISANLVRRK